MSYSKYYSGGWQSGATGKTPITPEALNHMEEGIANATTLFAQATEHSTYKGCFYRVIDGVIEWINPPMWYSTEYRTSERHDGKAVYIKAINIGSLPASGLKNVAHQVYTYDKMLSVDVFVNNGTILQQFPFLNSSDGSPVGKVHVTSANIAIYAFLDASDYSGFAVLRYTKS